MVATFARSQRSASRASPADDRALLTVGDVLAGKYRVTRLLGEGGMGVVVEAHHQLLDQRVAVKLLYRDVADKEAESRLLAEARAAAKLQSEHVARVVDVDVGADGLPFIVMELLEGADLCQVVDARGALPPWLVVDYMLQTLEGLAHAHGAGIVHRDLKPSNLYLSKKPDGTDVIKILDFGVSKSSGGAADRHTQQLTGGRTMLGSPPYMSPEQVRSPKRVDLRTDIWAIGICIYELLTNSMPFGGSELQETFAQILEKAPVPVRSLVPGVPDGLENVVMKCLAKNRDDRFSDVGELAAALAPFGSGAWTPYVERIQATLVRALVEDEITGVPAPRPPTNSSTEIDIPVAPGRRVDSLQPEFHGTASTVARRFTVFDAKRPWIVAGIAIPALVGIALAVVALRNGTPTSPSDVDLAAGRADPPAAATDPLAAATSVPAPLAPAATIDGDSSGAIQDSVRGASPMPDATSKTVKPQPPASVHAAAPLAPPARTLSKSSAPPSAKAASPALPKELLGRE